MKHPTKKLIAGMLVSVLMAVLAGCGKDKEDHSGHDHGAHEKHESGDHAGHNH